jgi:hypothetical protein
VGVGSEKTREKTGFGPVDGRQKSSQWRSARQIAVACASTNLPTQRPNILAASSSFALLARAE